jgi:hypothetical protein
MNDLFDLKEIKSDINEANLQIYRLNDLYILANQSSQKGKFETWRWILDNIWRELAVDAALLNEYVYTKKYIECENNVLKAFKTENKALIYWALSKKEIFLRKLQEAAGKGAKRSEKIERMM